MEHALCRVSPSKPSVPSAAIEARSAPVIMFSFITTDLYRRVPSAPVTYAIGCHDVKLWVLEDSPANVQIDWNPPEYWWT